MQEANKEKVVNMMGRPFTMLPLGTDLPRFAGSISVSNAKGDIVHQPRQGSENSLRNLRGLLATLSGLLLAGDSGDQRDKERQTKACFDDHFLTRNAGWGGGKSAEEMETNPLFFNEVVSKGLVAFLKEYFGEPSATENTQDKKLGPGSSKVIGAIKACNQAVISPAIIELKMAIGIQNMTKDVKDSWLFHIQVLSPSSALVYTTKREQHIQNMFQYQWKLSLNIVFLPASAAPASPPSPGGLVLSSTEELPIRVDKVELTIIDLMFHEFIHTQGAEHKDALKAALNQYLCPGVFEQSHSKQWEFYQPEEKGEKEEEKEEEVVLELAYSADSRPESAEEEKKRLAEEQAAKEKALKEEKELMAKQAAAVQPRIVPQQTPPRHQTPRADSQVVRSEPQQGQPRKSEPLPQQQPSTSPRTSTLPSAQQHRPKAQPATSEQKGVYQLPGGGTVYKGPTVSARPILGMPASPQRTITSDSSSPTSPRKGEIRYKNGDYYKGGIKGNMRDGEGVWTTVQGDMYVGEYKNDRRHGRGVYTIKDGCRYEGEFVNGRPHGQGTYVWPNGDMYTGTFENDEFHGKGSWSSAKGDHYEGDFVRGKRHGYGKSVTASGQRYEGQWADNMKEGCGKYQFGNGEGFEGEFKANKFHGKGIYYYSSGQKVEGLFENGKLSEITSFPKHL